MVGRVRPAACAGRFYPGRPERLRRDVERYLAEGDPGGGCPKALIVPHAGYVYSGPIAGTGYRRLQVARERIERVVLIGPAHYAYVDGLAASIADAFATPLGDVPLDKAAIERVLTLPAVQIDDAAHAPEHSLEVHLPFLQVVLGDFALVPLLVGLATDEDVADVLEALWGGDETVVVVSSDLSHYHADEVARRRDAATSRHIESLEGPAIGPDDACGCAGIRGLLLLARRRGLHAATLDLRNSGATAGPRDSVVGYGAFSVSSD